MLKLFTRKKIIYETPILEACDDYDTKNAKGGDDSLDENINSGTQHS